MVSRDDVSRHATEGELAKRRAGVVSTVALAEVARTIGLGEHILLGKGESASGGAAKAPGSCG